MQRCPRNLLVLGWLAMLLLAASAPNLTAQATGKDQAKAGDELAAKQVSIETIDKVELKGKFYPAKGKDATCVMLLHALGESSDNKEWNNFAKKLQEKGYAVLTFDFRGHGESTAVQPGMPNPKNPKLSVRGFWDEDLNRQGVKGLALNKPRPTEIKYADFAPTYYPVLCNDIAAARQFLDEQPDVNSNNLILIGAKDGATVGALWLNSEFHRFRYLSQSGQVARLDACGSA
jgi:pimeloyl-ACP methyl ester carboxylesterase